MKRITLVLVLVTLAGCASAPPERSYYLLRAEVPNDLAAAPPGTAAGLGLIQVAAYLDRAGVVVEVGANQVREARFHLWAEPLDRGIRIYLSDRIASQLGYRLETGPGSVGPIRYRIDVSVEEFHGALDGETRLVARWSVRDLEDDSLTLSRRFSKKSRQSGDGYASLVQSQLTLLDDFAAEIAQALTDLDQ